MVEGYFFFYYSRYPVKATVSQLPVTTNTNTPSLMLGNMKCLCLSVSWVMVLCLGGPHLCLQSPGLKAQQMTMYVAVGQSSGASRTMFLSPSSGQPSFLPMVARRLGWELALPILPGPSWAGSKARDETATSWEEPHRFRRRSLGHFCSRSSPSQAIF